MLASGLSTLAKTRGRGGEISDQHGVGSLLGPRHTDSPYTSYLSVYLSCVSFPSLIQSLMKALSPFFGGNRTPRMWFIRESWHLAFYMISELSHLLFEILPLQ